MDQIPEFLIAFFFVIGRSIGVNLFVSKDLKI